MMTRTFAALAVVALLLAFPPQSFASLKDCGTLGASGTEVEPFSRYVIGYAFAECPEGETLSVNVKLQENGHTRSEADYIHTFGADDFHYFPTVIDCDDNPSNFRIKATYTDSAGKSFTITGPIDSHAC